ncbi:MAG: hypothetical protein JO246_16325 [Frankiaceae bacterium]|nr:hypothetical protein [Frankiaceae bacterium]MBV9871772.1 hypothetical protein [Frankiaceae bacterium]
MGAFVGQCVARGVVVGLAIAYLVGTSQANPFGENRVGGGGSEPGIVGTTYYFNFGLGPTRDGAHITGIHADARGVRVAFFATSYEELKGDNRAGFPIRCGRGTTLHPVDNAPLRTSPETYLRMQVTPLRSGRVGVHSITVDWRNGIFHGSKTMHLFLGFRTHTTGTLPPC